SRGAWRPGSGAAGPRRDRLRLPRRARVNRARVSFEVFRRGQRLMAAPDKREPLRGLEWAYIRPRDLRADDNLERLSPREFDARHGAPARPVSRRKRRWYDDEWRSLR